MPYIKQELRDLHTSTGAKGKHPKMETVGQLNYELTTKILKYLKLHGESYQTYNDMIGALECAKLELYRRLVSYYEDTKIKENGDIY